MAAAIVRKSWSNSDSYIYGAVRVSRVNYQYSDSMHFDHPFSKMGMCCCYHGIVDIEATYIPQLHAGAI